MLKLENVTRSVGAFAINNISFAAGKGEYVVILGPTGCGKTILLETIAGIGRVDSGRVMIAGEDITRRSPEKRNIGFVYQRSMLFPHYSVAQNICYGMKLRKIGRSQRKQQLEKLAAMLSIKHLLDREVANLSGGESQKVALARALAIEPPILLLDEPLAPLDPPSRESLRREILKLHREMNTTIVHVTHDQLTARILADRIGVMSSGCLRQFGQAKEIFERPANEFVARFVGIENIFSGAAEAGDDLAAIKLGDDLHVHAACRISGKTGLCINPDSIEISSQPFASPGPNAFEGRVKDISDRGTVYRLTVASRGAQFIADIPYRHYSENPVMAGAKVFLKFAPEAVHCFQTGGEQP